MLFWFPFFPLFPRIVLAFSCFGSSRMIMFRLLSYGLESDFVSFTSISLDLLIRLIVSFPSHVFFFLCVSLTHVFSRVSSAAIACAPPYVHL